MIKPGTLLAPEITGMTARDTHPETGNLISDAFYSTRATRTDLG
jgi:hypothetical protein